MLFVVDKIVLSMAALRILSSTIEFTAALMMLRYNSVETAFKINALLAMMGPTIMITVTSLGIVGLAGKVPPQGLVFVVLGVASILFGISRF